MNDKQPDYVAENKRLRSLLAEAEALVEALMAGEIDAVAPPDTPPLLLREAQQALQESEQTFRAVFEGATDAMLIADDSGRYLQVNPAACKLFGVPEADLLGKRAADFAPPDFDFTAAWQKFQESGREIGKFQLLRPDGAVRVAEYSAVTGFLPGRHLSILRDVTERNQLEQERERALYELSERVKEATLLHRAGRLLGGHNKSIREVLAAIVALIPPAWQYPAITVARITFGELSVATPNYVSTRWCLDTKFQSSEGIPGSIEVCYLEPRPDADEGPFLAEERVTIEALANMVQSDLDRRRAEEDLRRSEKRHRTLFESMAQGVIYHDAQGKMVEANPAASRIFDRSREELLSVTSERPLPFVDEDGNRLNSEELPARVALRRGRPVRDVTIGIARPDKDGYRWVKMHSIPQFHEGEAAPYRVFTTFEDITERKQTEDTLRKREAMLARTEHVAHIGSWEWEIASDTVTWSEELFRIFGRDPEEGAPSFAEHSQIYPDADLERLRSAVARAVEEGISYRLVLRARRSDGEIRHCVARGHAEWGPDGQVTHLYGSFQDITDRKAAEEALRRSEGRYRSLFERMTQGIVYQNAEGEVIDANPAALSILGLTLDQVRGRTSVDPDWHAVRWDGSPFPGDEHPATVALQTGKTVEDVRMGVYNPIERSYRWLRVDAVPQFLEGEKRPYRVFSTFEDITTQVKEEEQRNRLATIVESSEDAIFDTDLEATVTSWNAGAERMSGYSADEVIGQPSAFLVPPEERKHISEILETVRRGEPVRNRELVARRKDGSLYVASINASPVRGHQDRVRGVAVIGRDVTQRKQREQRLRFQAQLLETVREAVVATDMERRVTYWGPGAVSLFDHLREDALGKDFRDLVPFLSPIPPGAQAEQLLAHGGWRGRIRFRRQDGQIVELDTSLALIRTESGEPGGFLAVLRDVTEQVWYEDELSAVATIGRALRGAQGAHETYRIILEQVEKLLAPDGTALSLLHQGGEITITRAASGRWQEQEGLRLVAGEGLTARVLATDEVFLTEDLGAEAGFRLSPLVSERTAAAALPLYTEGKAVGILWVTRPQPFTGRERRIFSAIGSLIAGAVHRARLYERLREQASQLEQIMESVDWGLLLLDEQMQIVLANDAATTYLPQLVDERLPDDVGGYRLQALGGQPLLRPLHPVHASTGQSDTLISLPNHDREFSIMVHPLEDTAGWVVVVRDVTDERRIQEQLAQRDRLASVGQMAAGIAHDFNNTISAIVLYSQIMQRDQGMAPRNRERLGVIFNQAEHAAKLVGQILDFSRRSVMERAAVDLVPLFKEWHKLWQRTLPENIRIDFHSAADSFVVNADPTRLQQAVMNIVINARDAMPEGGRLRIELKLLQLLGGSPTPLPGMDPGAWVAIAISDTGPGIEEEIRPHIFDPFFTTKAQGEGTGLGLAQAHGIIQQHEGHIDVRSQVGKGSTFTIYLRLLLQQEPRRSLPPMPEVRPVSASETTILVVEDQVSTRLAIKETLETLDYRVLTASGGLEALSILGSGYGSVHLLLTDMVMPDIGGMQLIERVQERYAGVQVLLMTGYPMDDASRSRLGEGQVAWIQKPFLVGELVERIEAILEARDE